MCLVNCSTPFNKYLAYCEFMSTGYKSYKSPSYSLKVCKPSSRSFLGHYSYRYNVCTATWLYSYTHSVRLFVSFYCRYFAYKIMKQLHWSITIACVSAGIYYGIRWLSKSIIYISATSYVRLAVYCVISSKIVKSLLMKHKSFVLRLLGP